MSLPRSAIVNLNISHVTIDMVDRTKPVFGKLVQDRINKAWDILNRKRQGLFNGGLLRVVDVSVDRKTNCVGVQVCSDISYKEIVGLRYEDGEVTSGLDIEVPIQVLSAYIIVYTADGYIFFIDRDSGDWKSALEFPGGFIQTRYNCVDGATFAYMRAASDLGISQDYFSHARCHGYIDAKDIFELVLVYSVQCDLSLEELKKTVSIPMYVVPEQYTPDLHSTWFNKRMLPIMQKTVSGFLEVVRSKNK